jgi:protein O-mannosyl-transferase
MPPQSLAEGATAPKPASSRRVDWPALACAGLVAGSALLAYSGSFAVPFLYDDEETIAANPSIRHLASALFPPAATTAGGRPLLNLSFAADYAAGGLGVGGYHAVNVAIHVLAGLALFGIVRRTLSARAPGEATPAALLVALLWTLHPLQTESVTYLAQRAESLMGLLYLLTLYCFVRSVERGARGRTAWSLLCVGACLLGMGTKEVMVSAPLIVLLYDRAFVSGSLREAWRARRLLYSGLALTWVALGFLVLSAHGRGGSAGFGTGVTPWQYALTQFPAIVHYLRLCVWPHPLIFDYGNALEPPSIRTLACALAVAALVAAAAWAFARNLAAGFLGAAFFAILAPSSSFVPVATETVAEHRMYLPLAAVAVLFVCAAQGALGRRGLVPLLVLAGVLGWLTFERNQVYLSDAALWADTVRGRPGNDRAHNYLGLAYEKTPGRLGDAIAQFEESLRLNPGRPQAHNYFGRVLEGIPGRLDEAIAQYREALRLSPDYADAHNNLGNALNGEGRTAEAVVQYQEALRLDPGNAEAHNNLGNALSMEGRFGEAVPQYEEALRLKPGFVGFHLNLAATLLQIPGRADEAAAHLREALRLDPENQVARRMLDGIGAAQR